MTNSVHTNSSALLALQNLNATNRELQETQTRVSTGFKVNGAKDNASVFAVAQNLRGDTAALGIVRTSLDRAQSIADVAIAAGETISNLFIELRERATAALDPINRQLCAFGLRRRLQRHRDAGPKHHRRRGIRRREPTQQLVDRRHSVHRRRRRH